MNNDLEALLRLYDDIYDGNLGKVKEKLASGAVDLNRLIPGREMCLLHLAVGVEPQDYSEQVTREILHQGGDPDVRTDEGMTPLHVAASWGRDKLVRLLLEDGADPYSRDDDDKTPLDYAMENQSVNVVECLLDYFKTDRDTYSPDKFSLSLDKIIIDNGTFTAEYSTNSTASDDSYLKSDYINSWCRKTSDVLNQSQELYRNRNGDIMFKKPLSFMTDSKNSNSDYQTCIDKLPELNEIINSDLSDTDSSLSGFDTLKFTKNDENNLYSVHKKTIDESTVPNLPVIHQNYDSKSSIRPSVRKEPKYLDETLMSVVEEYKYEDKEADVVLIEKRILANPVIISGDFDETMAQSTSSASSLPASIEYDVERLRLELKSLGVNPGPITQTTKRVYLKKLIELKKQPSNDIQPKYQPKKYSIELEKTFNDVNWDADLSHYIDLEQKVSKQFENPDPKHKWREGISKSNFTYLLLDPRITNNLPINKKSKSDQWKTFVDSIFYIGKGKRSRPYSHLYQAVGNFKSNTTSQDKKVQTILDIWRADSGVVCLHVFQNVIAVEAFTREAAMIDAIGLKNLTNIKQGNYYGNAAAWSLRDRKTLGVYLLYSAMNIFMHEGERRLRPGDIQSSVD